MTTHRARAVVGDGGSLTLRGLPLRAGEAVDVIVLARDGASPAELKEQARDRLRGSILKDERPFEPVVPPEEWDAAR